MAKRSKRVKKAMWVKNVDYSWDYNDMGGLWEAHFPNGMTGQVWDNDDPYDDEYQCMLLDGGSGAVWSDVVWGLDSAMEMVALVSENRRSASRLAMPVNHAKRSMRKKAEKSWYFYDDTYSITVDDFDVELIKSLNDGSWFFDVNDFDGYSATTLLFGQPSPYFDTPQEAVDWANDNVDWIGDWKFPRIASRKRSMRKRAGLDRDGWDEMGDGTWFWEGWDMNVEAVPLDDGTGDYAVTVHYNPVDGVYADEITDWGEDFMQVADDIVDYYRIASRKAMRKRAVWDWRPDDGFSGELTHYEGDYAYVVAEDWDYPGEWMLQVFNTASDYDGGELEWEQHGPYRDMDTAQEMAERWGTDKGMKVLGGRKRVQRKRFARKKAVSGAKRRARKAANRHRKARR